MRLTIKTCILLFALCFFMTGTLRTVSAKAWYHSNLRIDGGGWVTGIVVHPQEEHLRYVRTDVGGAYRWNQTRQKWIPISDWILYEESGLRATDAIALDPQNPDLVYLACGWWNPYGGVYKSSDRGFSFERLNFPHGKAIAGNDGGGGGAGRRTRGERLEVSPFDSNEMIFGIFFDPMGLYKTTDGGKDWDRLDLPGLGSGAEAITIVLHDRYKQGHFYAVVQDAGLYYTTNGGSSFSKIHGATRIMRMAQANDGTVYFTNASSSGGMVFKTKDGVVTDITNGIAQVEGNKDVWTHSKGLHAITTHPTDPQHIVVQGALSSGRYTVPTYESRDGGQTWDRFQITIGESTP